jgi:hypothetical protein
MCRNLDHELTFNKTGIEKRTLQNFTPNAKRFTTNVYRISVVLLLLRPSHVYE